MSDSATCGVSRTEGRPPGGSPRFCSKAPDAPEPARPPSKQAAKQPQQTLPLLLLLEDIIMTERQSCYLGKSATGGKKQVAGNKECREVAARRNPSSTVPRSIIPHSPNPASSATASPSAPPPPPNIAPDLEKLDETKTN